MADVQIKLPKLNPLQFYDKTEQEESNQTSFQAYTEHVNGFAHKSKQTFLDKCENIIYQQFILGQYGFKPNDPNVAIDNSAVPNTPQHQSIIYFNEIYVGAGDHPNLPITITMGAIDIATINFLTDKKIVIKSNKDLGGRIYDGTTYVSSFFEQSVGGLVTIDLPIQNYNDLKVKFKCLNYNGERAVVSGIAIPLVGLNHLLNDQPMPRAKLIDLSEWGGVYLLTTNVEVDFLPMPSSGDDYTDIIRKYRVLISQSTDTVLFYFYINGHQFYFGQPSGQMLINFASCYDWVSMQNLGSDSNGNWIVEVEVVGELTGVNRCTSGTGGSWFSPPIPQQTTFISQRTDRENWYLFDGISENFTNTLPALANIVGVIRAKKANMLLNDYRPYSQSLEVINGATQIPHDISSFPTEIPIKNAEHFSFGSDDGEILKIKKKAKIKVVGKCFQFSLGDGWYKSEYFDILTKEQAKERNLKELRYSNSEPLQRMIYDQFKGAMLLPFDVTLDPTQEVEVFNGQRSSLILGAEEIKQDKLILKEPIPLYLARKLKFIFNNDNVSVDGVSYTAKDIPEIEEVDNSKLFNFSVVVRHNSYDF